MPHSDELTVQAFFLDPPLSQIDLTLTDVGPHEVTPTSNGHRDGSPRPAERIPYDPARWTERSDHELGQVLRERRFVLMCQLRPNFATPDHAAPDQRVPAFVCLGCLYSLMLTIGLTFHILQLSRRSPTRWPTNSLSPRKAFDRSSCTPRSPATGFVGPRTCQIARTDQVLINCPGQ